jgi:hypothetical protein
MGFISVLIVPYVTMPLTLSCTKGTIYTLTPLKTVNLGVDLAISEFRQAFRVTSRAIVDLVVNEKY